MDTQTNSSFEFLQLQAASLLIYQSVLTDEVGQAFLNLLRSLRQIDLLQSLRHSEVDELGCVRAYGNYFKAIASRNQSWQDYLIGQILIDDNPFSRQAQNTDLADLPPSLIAAVQQDLQALQSLYQYSSEQLIQWVQAAAKLNVPPVAWTDIPTKIATEITGDRTIYYSIYHKLSQLDNWADILTDLAAYYRQYGTGIFAKYRALRWQSGQLIGIPYADPVQLQQLVGYEYQRDTLKKNTEFLLAGYPALPV
ncbi:DUF815 domain-containing protein, partial [Chroococcidiopsidales cyanobacterium LEGE 13417]|nr:DUF815 domain-containing protein [Chroococcidiopsidales cyanobacterium LEGE 13417]